MTVRADPPVDLPVPAPAAGAAAGAGVDLAARPRWDRRWAASALGLALLDVVVGSFLAVRTRHEWFFVDEWDFLTRRVGPHPPTGLLVPHNEHPSMLPILVWRALFDVFGLRRYSPYMAVVIACHLAVVLVVWAVARRCGAGPGASLVAAALMATAGVGWENMIWAFQIGMVGSLLASWGATVVVDRRRGAFGVGRLVVVWVLLTAGLACSAVSVALLVLPLLVAVRRRGVLAGLAVVCVPAVAFLGWYARWGREGVSPSRGFDPLKLAGYGITGLSSALDGMTGVVGTSAVALVLVFAGLRSGRLGGRSLPAAAGLVAAVAMYAFIAIGRASLGDLQAQASRYAYLVAALTLPAAAVGIERLVQRRPATGTGTAPTAGIAPAGTGPGGAGPAGARASTGRSVVLGPTVLTWVAVGLVAVALCGRGLGLLQDNIASRVAMARVMEPQAAAADALAAQNVPLLSGVATNKFSGFLDAAGVLRLHRLGALTPLPRTSAAEIADSRILFQTRLAARTTRPVLDRASAPLPPAPLAEYPTTATTLDPLPVTVVPQPAAAAPTVLAGRPVALARGITAATGCVSTSPAGGAAAVQLRPGTGTRAVLVLVESSADVEYSWAGPGSPFASRTAPVDRDTVEQLTTVGDGLLRISAQVTLTVCPVR